MYIQGIVRQTAWKVRKWYFQIKQYRSALIAEQWRLFRLLTKRDKWQCSSLKNKTAFSRITSSSLWKQIRRFLKSRISIIYENQFINQHNVRETYQMPHSPHSANQHSVVDFLSILTQVNEEQFKFNTVPLSWNEKTL